MTSRGRAHPHAAHRADAPPEGGAHRLPAVPPGGPGRAPQGRLADPRRGPELLDHRADHRRRVHRLRRRARLRCSARRPSGCTTDERRERERRSDRGRARRRRRRPTRPIEDVVGRGGRGRRVEVDEVDVVEAVGRRRRRRPRGRAADDEDVDDDEAEPWDNPWTRPGDWYVVHTQSGYEKKVKTNLEARIQSMNMEDKIFEVVIPMEDVVEFKGGKKVVVQRKVFPGYLLVRCQHGRRVLVRHPQHPGRHRLRRPGPPRPEAHAAQPARGRDVPGRQGRRRGARPSAPSRASSTRSARASG